MKYGMRCGFHEVCGKRIYIVEHHILMVLIKEDGLDYDTLSKEIYKLQERLNPRQFWKWNYKNPTIRKGLTLLMIKDLIITKKDKAWRWSRKRYYLNDEVMITYFDFNKPVERTQYQ